MKIESNILLDFNDILIKPKRSDLSSRSEVDLTRTFKFKHSNQTWTGVPIMTSNMTTTGTFEMYEVLSEQKIITVFHKFYNVENFKTFKDNLLEKGKTFDKNFYSLSTGINNDEYQNLKEVIEFLDPMFLTIDVANGYSTKFVEFCKKVRQEYPELVIIAGNVATSDMVQELLISSKVDIVKCGIGSGSVCSTRLKTGVGVPQLSVCLNCSETANGLDGHIVSDGGCTVPGDIAKAFGAGSHFVMLGGMLAGHDESGGESVEKDGKKFKIFYGMSSEYAQNKFNGGMENYRSSEGKVRYLPDKGKVFLTMLDILGGLRSTGTYIGAKRLKDFAKCTTFSQVNRQLNTVYDNQLYL
jgi:GMP reductase